MMSIWNTLAVLSTLLVKTLQHGDEAGKPSSVNGCYHGDEGSFFWTIKGKIGFSHTFKVSRKKSYEFVFRS